MKKIILLFLLVSMAAYVSAQGKIRLNGYASYVFDDGFEENSDVNTYFNGTVKGGLQWGGGLEYLTNSHYGVEIMFLTKNSTAPVDFRAGLANPAKHEDFDVTLNYLMLVGNRYAELGSSHKVDGYGGLMLGALFSNVESPSTGKSGSHTSFAWGGRVGANIWASEKFGIKLQAQILSASKATGGELYFSYYGPIVLETYTTLWQFGLGGGITIKLGK